MTKEESKAKTVDKICYLCVEILALNNHAKMEDLWDILTTLQVVKEKIEKL